MLNENAMLKRHVRWYISFALGAFFGALVFISLYGVRILDVTYDDWLLTGWYDLSQHYAGWQLYRASAWHFPFGLCDTSLYPYLASVIYTDSIPIVCLLLKIISPLLPPVFQFFGLYGLFCFMMQGGVAKLLLRRVVKTEAQCCVAVIPFLFCAPLWQRMYYHTALASHYLILIAILFFVYRDKVRALWKRILLWCALGALCISVHFTIYGMVSVMLLGFALWEALDGAGRSEGRLRKIRSGVLIFLSFLTAYLAATVLTFYLFGGFYGGISGVSDGLGSYSANLNSLFNPIDYSRIIKELPLIDCQYEGLSYIGIAAVIFELPALIGITKNLRLLWSKRRNEIISGIVTSAALWVIALSPIVTFGSIVLFEIPVPDFIYDVWSLFRASGRFLWPVMYAVILINIYFARDELKAFFVPVLVAGCLLQLFEFSEKVTVISRKYENLKDAHFTADSLDLYDFEGIEHLQFMHDYYFGEFYQDSNRDQLIGYTEFALRNGMTVSNFHFSRDDMEKVWQWIDRSDAKLREGMPDRDTIYMFRNEDVDKDEVLEKYSGVTWIFTDKEMIAVPER